MGTYKDPLAPYCRLTKRPLGRILLEGGFITKEELDTALDAQMSNGRLLGDILVEIGSIGRDELHAALSIQRNLASYGDILPVLSGAYEIVDDLLLESGKITQKQYEQAREERTKSGSDPAEALYRLGFISLKDYESILEFQKCSTLDNRICQLKLGELMVATGHITRDVLDNALTKQKNSKKKLGEILIEDGHVHNHILQHLLKLQRKLMTAALVALLTINITAIPASADLSKPNKSTSAVMHVTATILPQTSMKTLHQISELTVTNSDIQKGFIEVRSASLIEISSNAPYLLMIDGLSRPFESLSVSYLGKDVEVFDSGGVVIKNDTRRPATYELSYRFNLDKDTSPGTYAWPVVMTVTPL